MNQTSNTQASYLENISSDHHMIDDNNPQIIEDDGRCNLQSSENLNIIKDKIMRQRFAKIKADLIYLKDINMIPRK